jgi:hypothetical protein
LTALFLGLEKEGPLPFALWIGRLCEEFHCVPSVAYAEWLRAPTGLLEDILEARAFAAAYDLYINAKSKRDLPKHPMIDRVKAIDFAIAEEDRERARHGG